MKFVWLSWTILSSLILVVCLTVGGMIAGTFGIAIGVLVFLCFVLFMRLFVL